MAEVEVTVTENYKVVVVACVQEAKWYVDRVKPQVEADEVTRSREVTSTRTKLANKIVFRRSSQFQFWLGDVESKFR